MRQENLLEAGITSFDIAAFLEKIILGGVIFILALPLFGDYGAWLFPIGRDVVFKLTVELLWILFLLKVIVKNTKHKLYKTQIKAKSQKTQNTKVWALGSLWSVFYLCFGSCVLYFRKSLISLSLVIFWFIMALSVIFSVQPDFSLWGNIYKNQGLMTWTHYILFFLLLVNFLRDKSNWRLLINVSIAIGAAVALIALWQFLNSGFALRAASTLNNPNYLAAYLILLIPLTFALFIKNRSFFLGSAVTLQFLALLFTQTRGGYLGVAVALFTFTFLYLSTKKTYKSRPKFSIFPPAVAKLQLWRAGNFQFSKRFLLSIISIIVIGIYALILFTNPGQSFQKKLPNFTDRFLNYRNIKNNAAPRLEAWQAGWKGMLEKPLLGYGPENFFVAFDSFYSGTGDHRGSLAKRGSLWETWFDKAHNFIFDIGATSGFLGLFAYLGIFSSAIIMLLRRLSRAKRQWSVVCAGLIASFAGYLTQNLLGFDTIVPGLYLMFLLAYMHFLTNGNSKHEARNSKQYLNSNLQNTKPPKPLGFNILNLFRASSLDSARDDLSEVERSDFARLAERERGWGFRILLLCITLTAFSLFIFSFKIHSDILKANYNLNLAESLTQKGKIEQAFAAYEKGLGYNSPPINPNLRRRYAVIALAYYEAIEKRCNAGLNGQGSDPLRGSDPDGLKLMCEKLYKDSEKYLNRALVLQQENAAREWPRFTRNYIYAAQISHILSNYEKSDEFFEKALMLSPNRASIYVEWSRLLDERGEIQKSEEKLKKAKSINPKIQING